MHHEFILLRMSSSYITLSPLIQSMSPAIALHENYIITVHLPFHFKMQHLNYEFLVFNVLVDIYQLYYRRIIAHMRKYNYFIH